MNEPNLPRHIIDKLERRWARRLAGEAAAWRGDKPMHLGSRDRRPSWPFHPRHSQARDLPKSRPTTDGAHRLIIPFAGRDARGALLVTS